MAAAGDAPADRAGRLVELPDQRLASLRAVLGFVQVPSREHELQLLQGWLDTWTGIGPIAVGVEWRGLLAVAESHHWEGYSG
jgi:hypothetical protein